ncbi:MAG TPA: Ig-like domain-containing protein, partial [Candidatus Binatia bacterium]|nr:Ig-like domain-containing protein [Candidatus Binatia bacterium]
MISIRTFIRFAAMGLLLIGGTLAIQAQPANDLFANAWTLTGLSVSTNGSNTGAGKETGEPNHAGNQGGRSVWYNWTAPANTPIRVDTLGSGFNTLLAVYTGSAVNALTTIASNNDAPGGGTTSSLLEFAAVQGTTYRIAVDASRNFGVPNGGNYLLRLQALGSATITSPTNGAVFQTGAPIPVDVQASVPNPPVTRVDLYRGGILIGSDSAAPYSITASNSPLATNMFFAVAVDSAGLSWTSAVVRVAVLDIGVTIVSPPDGQLYANANPITINAATLLTAGAMTNVQFLADGVTVGEDAASPYSVTWSGVTPGVHRLSAIGRADNGLSYTSAPVLIGVVEQLIPMNSVWKYLDNGSNQGTNWSTLTFDDTLWKSGPAELGYGDGDEATVVEDNGTPGYNAADTDRYITTYFRRSIVITNPAAFSFFVCSVERDDAAVVYFNGAEVFRSPNLPARPTEITYTTTATGNGIEDTTDVFGIFGSNLQTGTNVIAVEIHQQAPTSSDISFNLELLGVPVIVRNQTPAVAVTSPTNNANFLAPPAITLEAVASDTDGSVAKVEFFVDGAKVGEDTAATPQGIYSFDWTNPPLGPHTLTAVATDDQGATGNSGPVTVHVYDAAGSPFARITRPADGSSGEGPTNIVIESYAGAVNGITNVEFYAGTSLIGSSAVPGISGLVADYQFQNSLSSSVATAPSLVNLGPNTFGSATVDGSSRMVLQFAANDGLSLSPASDLIPNNVYTVVMLFSFNDVTSWRRIIDFKDTATDNGLYVYDSDLQFYPFVDGPPNAIPANTFVQVALTRDSGKTVTGYVNGVQQFSFVDSPDEGALGPGNVLRFFRDNGLEGSAGSVARIRIFNAPLTAGQIGTLDRLPASGAVATPEGIYSTVWSAPFGTYALTTVAVDANGRRGTSAPVNITITVPPTNTVAPTIAAQVPAAGANVTNLTSIQVTFSERVQGINAGDLLINGLAATGLSGGGSNYTFTFPQPAYGTVAITWASGHGITDFGYPSNLPFDAAGPGATWNYNFIDRTPPVIATRNPAAGTTVTNLSQIAVTFSEPVTGVDASDLLVNGTPALSVTGSTANYVFAVAQPPSGPVSVTWAGAHGIRDLAASPNAFDATAGGATWNFTLDARTIFAQSNSVWLFIKGLAEASTPIDAWRQRVFDDSSWSNALAPLYYGDPYPSPGNPGTLLSDMANNGYSSIYLRQAFVVGNVSAVTNLLLNYQCDDGLIVWINGFEVFRTNMPPGDVPYNGSALGAINEPQNNGAPYVVVPLPDPATYLIEGTNVLAVHAFNVVTQPASSDFGFNAQLYSYLADPTVVPPRVAQVTPVAGDVFYLTNITIRFTEPVSGVNAGDLLVNGVAATGLASTTNTTYTFSFAQPAYGTVSITWAVSHGIADFDSPAKAFDGNAPGSTFQYTLLNPNAPVIASQTPLANATVNSLTQITVSFNEPVSGVNASDFLVNGVPATSVSGNGATYTFTFVQPAYGAVSVGWAASHGITDLDVPANAFDAKRVGSTWSYNLVDQAPPTIGSVNPTAGSQVTNLTQVIVTFSEPVAGVNASDLHINGTPASAVSGGPASYTFTFAQPNATTVNFTWAAAHGIRDLAVTPNSFNATAPGATWAYTTPDTLAPSIVSIDPLPHVTVRSLTRIQIMFSEPVSGVGTNDMLINGQPTRQVTGSGAGPYTFNFPSPTNGPVDVRWSPSHGITDLADPPNPFAGGEWNYILDPAATFAGKVLINEIMFNPLGGAVSNEWIEVRNVSTGSVNVAGWRFTRGVNFTFPNVSMQAGGYLVVAANVAAFRAKYPGVTNVVGGWSGRLANSEETIELETALGETVNSVHYASEGDWARRERGHGAQPVLGINLAGNTATVTVFGHGFTGNDRIMISGADQPEYNGIFTISAVGASTFNITVPAGTAPATGNIIARHVIDDGASGWSWFCAADGLGSSLELVNQNLPNTTGQNWLSSAMLHGTPGRANSVATNNIAPFIQQVTHVPTVPRSTEPVAINARVSDELPIGVANVRLFYRDHTSQSPGAFVSTNMFDDGTHSDGVASDGLYGVVLPAAANGTVIEFYVQATDTSGLVRTWPAAAWDTNNTFGQLANAYYQVDDEVITNLMPTIRVIMSGTERGIYQAINRNSDAEMNVTMIATDGDNTEIHHLGGVRIRGAGTRSRNVPNNRLNLPNDNPWNGLSALNLNSQFVHAQLMGGAVARKAGLAAADARVFQYRMNGVNPAQITAPAGGQGDGYGTFLMVQPVNGDLATDLFPDDGDGNVYRASSGGHVADLTYLGSNPSSYIPRGYFKTSNRTENDWTDLLNLTFTFSQVSDADFLQAVSTNVNIVEWMKYFAVGTLLNFGETSLFNGIADDYALYRGLNDPRFVVIGHDFDTVFGQGDTGPGYYPINTNASIFTMLNPPNPNANVTVLRRFMTNATVAPLYYAELKRLCDTTFLPSNLNPLFDQLLSGWGTGPTTTTIDAMKTYAANRRSVVLSQIPLALTVTHSLVSSNGLPYTTSANVALSGAANAIETRQVLVNGAAASWS